jgi:hypothetical protein
MPGQFEDLVELPGNATSIKVRALRTGRMVFANQIQDYVAVTSEGVAEAAVAGSGDSLDKLKSLLKTPFT